MGTPDVLFAESVSRFLENIGWPGAVVVAVFFISVAAIIVGGMRS